jgi:hypothetical protein
MFSCNYLIQEITLAKIRPGTLNHSKSKIKLQKQSGEMSMLLHFSWLTQTYLRHSKVTVKDRALRIDVQCTLEVIFGQFELLLSKVLSRHSIQRKGGGG